MAKAPTSENRYTAIARKIFLDRYRGGAKDVAFEREDIEKTATKLKIDLPKNLGDLIYAIRYRMAMPEEIVATQPKGMEWVIEGTGRACDEAEAEAAGTALPGLSQGHLPNGRLRS